jgi:hypothetical protein
MKVNGFDLPPSLAADLNTGRTQLRKSEIITFQQLLVGVDGPRPILFDRRGILIANRLWTSAHVQSYLGTPSQKHYPGDIDPRKALVIGQAEPDSPIALDYRVEIPRVLYLGDFDHKSFWSELAPTYDDLLAKPRK